MPVFSKPSWTSWLFDGAGDEQTDDNAARNLTSAQGEQNIRIPHIQVGNSELDAGGKNITGSPICNFIAEASRSNMAGQRARIGAFEQSAEPKGFPIDDMSIPENKSGDCAQTHRNVTSEQASGKNETEAAEQVKGSSEEQQQDQEVEGVTDEIGMKQEPDVEDGSLFDGNSDAELSDASMYGEDDATDVKSEYEDEEEQQNVGEAGDQDADISEAGNEDENPNSFVVCLKYSKGATSIAVPTPAVKEEELDQPKKDEHEEHSTKMEDYDTDMLEASEDEEQLSEEFDGHETEMADTSDEEEQHPSLIVRLKHRIGDVNQLVSSSTPEDLKGAKQPENAPLLPPSIKMEAEPKVKGEPGVQEEHGIEQHLEDGMQQHQPDLVARSVVREKPTPELDPMDIMSYYTRYSPDDEHARDRPAPSQGEKNTEPSLKQPTTHNGPSGQQHTPQHGMQRLPDARQSQTISTHATQDQQRALQSHKPNTDNSYGNTARSLSITQRQSPQGTLYGQSLYQPLPISRASTNGPLLEARGNHNAHYGSRNYYFGQMSGQTQEPIYNQHGVEMSRSMPLVPNQFHLYGQQSNTMLPQNNMYSFNPGYFHGQMQMPMPDPYQQGFTPGPEYYMQDHARSTPQMLRGVSEKRNVGYEPSPPSNESVDHIKQGSSLRLPAKSRAAPHALGKRKAKYVVSDDEDEDYSSADQEESSDDDEPLMKRKQRHYTYSNTTDSVLSRGSRSSSRTYTQDEQHEGDVQYVGMQTHDSASGISVVREGKKEFAKKPPPPEPVVVKQPPLRRPLPVPKPIVVPRQSSSEDSIALNFALPKYNVEPQPNDPQTDQPSVKVSLPRLVRETLLLSPDHAALETHLLAQLFIPGQQALAEPDPRPEIALLNFHTVCVMVLDEFTQFEIGDLISGRNKRRAVEDKDSEEEVRHFDARDADIDEIFFAVIDRWRVGMARNKKKNYALIRGVQEFCDIALDIIYYIKEHGLGKEKARQRKQRCDKGVKKGPRGTKAGEKVSGKGKEVATAKKGTAITKRGPGRPRKDEEKGSAKKTTGGGKGGVSGKGAATVLTPRKKQKTGTGGKEKDKWGKVSVVKSGAKRK